MNHMLLYSYSDQIENTYYAGRYRLANDILLYVPLAVQCIHYYIHIRARPMYARDNTSCIDHVYACMYVNYT